MSPPSWRRAVAWIPRGRPLPPEVWQSRHRWVIGILAAQSVGIPFYAVYRGHSAGEALVAMLVPSATVLLASWKRIPNRARAALAASGLMAVSAVVVLLSDGVTEARFHYLVMIPLAALYQDWVPFGVAVGSVLVQHGVVGRLAPGSVSDQHDAHTQSWLWAGVHAGYLSLACLAAIVNWKLHEQASHIEGGLTAALDHQVHHDALTGLPTRVLFVEQLDQVLDGDAGSRGPPTVLMLDLDGFKDVNDTYGHHFGDLLLVEVAQRLRRAMRSRDTVTRLSGDEFAILLADPRGEQAADRVISEITEPFHIESMELDLEVSIGIATAEDGDDSAALLRKADTAMYVAKQQRLGRTRFAEDHRRDTTTRLDMLGALRRAMQTEEIVVHYQPQVSLSTGEVVGVEALARWQHPTRGLLAPSEFVPVLERTSLSSAFTRHVLTAVLEQSSSWLDRGIRLPVAVNITPRCLLDPGLVDVVSGRLAAAGVPGELLCLEVSETTVMTDPERAVTTLRQIRAMGVRVALDDYGTGYSSMTHLRVLPVDELKIDQSFVHHLSRGDQHNAVLVRSMIQLGHDLGLVVVAEGVEEARVMVGLKKLGCDVVQGYHVSRPLTAAGLHAWLARRGPPPRPADDTADVVRS